MNRTEHLLTIVQEECNETGQRAAKAQRFGLLQVQEDADDRPEENPRRENNAQRMLGEFHHIVAVLDMLGLVDITYDGDVAHVTLQTWALREKQARVEKYLQRSERCGTFNDMVVREMRTMAIVSGQASVEGPLGELAEAQDKFARLCAEWADRLEGKMKS